MKKDNKFLNRRILLTSGLLAGGTSFLISCKDNNENKKNPKKVQVKKNTLKYQLLNIKNLDGYFVIVYNNWKSDKLYHTITSKKLKKNLEKIPNIGNIEIEKIKDLAYVIHFTEKDEHQLQLFMRKIENQGTSVKID